MAIPSILSILAGDGGVSALFVYLVLATGFLAFQGMSSTPLSARTGCSPGRWC